MPTSPLKLYWVRGRGSSATAGVPSARAEGDGVARAGVSGVPRGAGVGARAGDDGSCGLAVVDTPVDSPEMDGPDPTRIERTMNAYARRQARAVSSSGTTPSIAARLPWSASPR